MSAERPQAPLRIAVVGAGSSGLLLTLLLQRQGHHVELFERSPQLRSEGCGILLVRSGVEALAGAGIPGLLNDLLAAGRPVEQFVIRNLRGDLIETSPAEREPGELPSLLIRRQAILEALWRHADPGSFRGGAELEHWQQDAGGVEARFSNGQRWQGDLLIGADGVFSRVAPLLAPQRRLHYLGDRVWRGVAADGQVIGPGDFLVVARGRGVYANAFDLGPEDPRAGGAPITHWGFFQEEPLPTSRAEQRRLLQEPVPEQALAKIPADLAALIRATPPERVVANWSFDIEPLPHLVAGRVALIGDAGHAMSSSQARGMTAGLEDAVSLARHLAGGDAPQQALAAYEAERLPVVHRYQERSRAISARTGRIRAPQQQAVGAR
ncbi:FAD-dependent oxidoreductase [Vulcanococcus limneticus]|uniref:FAD-dependent oxidoreductase n=1 Tax=Vulcanococcus limneticus TaxID=2170428 RepID=UPI00398C0D38